MKDEIIYSRVWDKNINKDLKNSPIWKDAHHIEELESIKGYHEYRIRFDGLTPIQVLKTKQSKNEKSN